MSLTTYEMARLLEQIEESPEKVMFSKLLCELGNQSEERIRRAAKQVPLHILRDIVYQFQQVIDSRKSEQVKLITEQLVNDNISVEELLTFLDK